MTFYKKTGLFYTLKTYKQMSTKIVQFYTIDKRNLCVLIALAVTLTVNRLTLNPGFNASLLYCEIIECRGHELSWFDKIGHVRGHLNSWSLNYMQYY